MKVLLINPPNRFWLWPPLGIAYIAAVLEKAGHYVRILDMGAEPEIKLENILNMQPNIVGITCTSQTFQSALTVARIVKAYSKDIVVVFGGSHPSSMPNKTVEHEEVDIVVKGEGEKAMLDLCNGDCSARVVQGEAMDVHSIPLPARELLPMEKYDYPGSILTSRGCPFRCGFCVHSVSGFAWRGRKPDDVADEIELLANKYKTLDIHVVDDNFSLNVERAKNIMRLLIDKKLSVNLWFYNGLRADRIDSELLHLMKLAGTKLISFGLESISAPVLKNMGKKVTLKQVEDAIAITHKMGIQVRVSLMIGNIGDTFDTIMDTVRWVQTNTNLDAAEFSLCTAYPDTPLYDWVAKNGRMLADSENNPTYFMDKEATPSFDTSDFPAAERIKALRIAQRVVQRKFFFKNRSLRHFKIRRIPLYASSIASLITGRPMKPKFRR